MLKALQDAQHVAVPVTVDTHDWMFEFYRGRATQPGQDSALVEQLVANVDDALREAEAIAEEKLGRAVPQIILLHVNQVTAAALPAVLRRLAETGRPVVPLAQAMADPLYQEPDAWAGQGSRWWLARTTPTERPDGSPWYTSREAQLREQLEAAFPRAPEPPTSSAD